MGNNRRVSVIMSVFNEEKQWLIESIESILRQSYNNIEFIIVLDNPYASKLKVILEKYKDNNKNIKVVYNKENKGLVKSLNEAIKNSTGYYIARMDADDISLSNRIDEQVKYLELNNLDFVFSGVDVIDSGSEFQYSTYSGKIDYNETRNLLEIGNISKHPTWIMKAEIYRKLNGYRDIKYCEDYDFILRSLQNYYKIGKCEGNWVKYRIRNNSISRSNSFSQFMLSSLLLKKYKQNKLDDYSSIKNYEISLKNNNFKEERNQFQKADVHFQKGIVFVKNKKYVKGFFTVGISLIRSKHYMSKILNIVKFKIHSHKIYRRKLA